MVWARRRTPPQRSGALAGLRPLSTLRTPSDTLPEARFCRILKRMEIHFTPETEKKLNALATQSGRGTDDLVEEAMAGYLDEVVQVRDMLDSRYDDLKKRQG
jgi:predicted DNA-binding protein